MMKSTNPPAPPFGLRPSLRLRRASGSERAVSDPEGKGGVWGNLKSPFYVIKRTPNRFSDLSLCFVPAAGGRGVMHKRVAGMSPHICFEQET